MRPLWFSILVILGIALLLQAVSSADDRIPYARFRTLAEQGEITELEIREDVYVGRARPDPLTNVPRTYRTGRIETTEKDLLAALDQRGTPYVRAAGSRVPSAVWWLAPTPTNISTKSDPEIEKNGTPASPATARASSVLPVPGGPTRSTPLGMRPPRRR